MKNLVLSVVMLTMLPGDEVKEGQIPIDEHRSSRNLIVITLDGVRWQEVFKGADSAILADPDYTPDRETMISRFSASNPEQRRERLMPFVWTVLAKSGQLWGDRRVKNYVNVYNSAVKSYPGYNELLTGYADPAITSNAKRLNSNVNVFEWLNTQQGLSGEVATFASWNRFAYILNETRNKIYLDCGNGDDNGLSNKGDRIFPDTRDDRVTFMHATEYMHLNHPRVTYIAFGETDEFAHQQRYDLYLQQINRIDQMIGELWHWIQSTEGYKDQTTLLITTDHGRGRSKRNWTSHGAFIPGSSEIFFLLMGPAINPSGLIKTKVQLYQRQLAPLIARLAGKKWRCDESMR